MQAFFTPEKPVPQCVEGSLTTPDSTFGTTGKPVSQVRKHRSARQQ